MDLFLLASTRNNVFKYVNSHSFEARNASQKQAKNHLTKTVGLPFVRQQLSDVKADMLEK